MSSVLLGHPSPLKVYATLCAGQSIAIPQRPQMQSSTHQMPEPHAVMPDMPSYEQVTFCLVPTPSYALLSDLPVLCAVSGHVNGHVFVLHAVLLSLKSLALGNTSKAPAMICTEAQV